MSQLTEMGAPTLGPGYFYRVHAPGLFDLAKVSIREKKWFFSVKRADGSALFGAYNEKTFEEGVIEAATKAYNNLLEERERRRSTNSIVGDHEGGWTVKERP